MQEITKSLIKFHMTIGKIAKDSNNPFFNSKYASLSNILSVVTPALIESDLNIIQMPVGDGELKTILSHISGEYIESTFNMKLVKSDPQALGSAITYARRYAIGAILNLNIEEDDDANKAVGQPKKDSLDRLANSAPKPQQQQRHTQAPPAPQRPPQQAPQGQHQQPATSPSDWLNATTKNGEITANGLRAVDMIIELGELEGWKMVRQEFKVSKADKAFIDSQVDARLSPAPGEAVFNHDDDDLPF